MTLSKVAFFAILAAAGFCAEASAQVGWRQFSFSGSDGNLQDREELYENQTGSDQTKTVTIDIDGDGSGTKTVRIIVGPCNITEWDDPAAQQFGPYADDEQTGNDKVVEVLVPDDHCIFIWEVDNSGTADPDASGKAKVS